MDGDDRQNASSGDYKSGGIMRMSIQIVKEDRGMRRDLQKCMKWIFLLSSLLSISAAMAGEYKSYEEISTAKAGQAYDEDINVWVYTSEFAKRFAMPKQWIDDDLKGAYAVAFRVETSSARLFFPHKGPSVSMPTRRCILDVYIDRKAPIPWVDDTEMGFQYYTPSSMTYLAPQNKEDVDHRRRPVGLPLSGVISHRPLVELGNKGRNEGGTIFLREFDKDVYPGVTYISFSLGCGTPSKKDVWIEFREDKPWNPMKIPVMHRLEIPSSFMQRLYDNWYEKSREPATGEWGGVINTPSRK